MNYVIVALLAYLSGSGSFKIKGRTVTIANTGVGPVKFSFALAKAAAIQAVLLPNVPETIVIGSTSITVS
jgi:hypothetical protein